MTGGSDMKGLRCIGSGRGGCISISPTTILESGKVDEWMDHFWVDDVGKVGRRAFSMGMEGNRSVATPEPRMDRDQDSGGSPWERRPQLLAQWQLQ